MIDDDLLAQLALERAEADDILQQLSDDVEERAERGQVWRNKARQARRYRLFRANLLEQEGRRRGLAVDKASTDQIALRRMVEAERTERSASRAAKHLETMRQQQEGRAQTERARSERIRETEKRDRQATQLFVKAAYHTLPREQFDLIWTYAREMGADIGGRATLASRSAIATPSLSSASSSPDITDQ